MKVLVVLVALAVAVSARMPFVLPDGADVFLRGRSLDTSFSCANRRYGYYADVENDCAIFHICQPITDAAGQLLETAHFSFICGEDTIFSQGSLTCAAPDLAYPCSEASFLYEPSNAAFGIIGDFSPVLVPTARFEVTPVEIEAPVSDLDEEEADIFLEVVEEEEEEAVPLEV